MACSSGREAALLQQVDRLRLLLSERSEELREARKERGFRLQVSESSLQRAEQAERAEETEVQRARETEVQLRGELRGARMEAERRRALLATLQQRVRDSAQDLVDQRERSESRMLALRRELAAARRSEKHEKHLESVHDRGLLEQSIEQSIQILNLSHEDLPDFLNP